MLERSLQLDPGLISVILPTEKLRVLDLHLRSSSVVYPFRIYQDHMA